MVTQNKHLRWMKHATIIGWFMIGSFILSLGVMASAEEQKLIGKTVNINTATVEQFLQVPLITKELAERIVKYRQESGDFQVLEELLQVEGFTRELIRKIKGFLLLEGIGGDECTC